MSHHLISFEYSIALLLSMYRAIFLGERVCVRVVPIRSRLHIFLDIGDREDGLSLQKQYFI